MKIVAIFVYTILHEFIHGVFIPNVLTSDKTFWGFNGLFGFVYTYEPMKKNRKIINNRFETYYSPANTNIPCTRIAVL